jgi:ubiquinone/menaquinone biosynthesis C-methylase UbiE
MFEPSDMEVHLTIIVNGTLLRGYHRAFAESLCLTGGERVLDWCVGSGGIARQIARKLSCGHLVFADVSGKWLACAGRRLRACTRAQAHRIDGFAGPIAGGGFDRIVVHFALHDFPKELCPVIIAQLAENLAPGGILALREPVSKAGSHGIRLCDLFNPLEADKALRYDYEIRKRRLVGETVDVRCRRMI